MTGANMPTAKPMTLSALRPSRKGARAMIASDGGVYAVLTVYGSRPYAFPSGTVRLLEEIAGDLAAGVSALRARAGLV